MNKLDWDDKLVVTVCVTALLGVAMFVMPPEAAKEVLILGLGGLLGFVTGRSK